MSVAALIPAARPAAFTAGGHRARIQSAVVAELERLHRRAGRYLEFVGVFDREFSGGDLEELFQRLLGQAPAALIRIGSESGASATASKRRYLATTELEIAIFSNNLRSPEARIGGDVASLSGTADPGLNAIGNDLLGLLLGRDIGAGVRVLAGWDWDPAIRDESGAVDLLSFAVQADVRPAKIPAEGSAAAATSVQGSSTIPTATPRAATQVSTLSELGQAQPPVLEETPAPSPPAAPSRYAPDAAAWLAKYSSPAPTAICTMQDAPGAAFAAEVLAGRHLVVSGDVTFGHPGEGGRTCARANDQSAGLICNDLAFPNLAANGAFTVWARMRFPSDTGVDVAYGALSGSDPRWYVSPQHLSNWISLLVDDGTLSRSAAALPTTFSDHYDEWIDIIATVDFATGAFSCGTSFSFGSATLLTIAQATMASLAAFHVFSSGAGGNGTPGAECGYLAVWDGYALPFIKQAEILAAA